MKPGVVAVLVLAVVTLAWGFTCPEDAEGNVKNPESGEGLFGAWRCMTYYKCETNANKTTTTKESCFWLVPIRQFNPETSKCGWSWDVDCKANQTSWF